MNFSEKLFDEKDKELLIANLEDLHDAILPNCIYVGKPLEEMTVEELIQEINQMLKFRELKK